jgi:hypothetical protein
LPTYFQPVTGPACPVPFRRLAACDSNSLLHPSGLVGFFYSAIIARNEGMESRPTPAAHQTRPSSSTPSTIASAPLRPR